MKKLLLLLLLIPFTVFAKFNNGIVYFNDGTSKKGYIEVPDYPDDAKLKFRADEKGKTQKIEIDLVKGFDVTNDKNETFKYTTILLAQPKIFTSDQFKLETKKSWVRIVKEGKIDIYQTYSVYSHGSKTGGDGSVYIHKKDENHAYFIAYYTGGFNIVVNGYSATMKYVDTIFEKDCPSLSAIITKDDLKKNGYNAIVEIYEQNCGK